jgi:predicted NUDIX family NTP pyrophosphohydrolase
VKQSSGTLLWRRKGDAIEVILVHPSGAYNAKAPWGLPKGEPDPGETMEAAARRETLEEIGVVAGELTSLGFVDYKKSKKRVHGFAGPAPDGCVPRCASWEVDKAEFVPLARAREIMHVDQALFIERLEKLLQG